VTSTRISRRINAPRAAVYRALLGARTVEKWKVPEGMTCHVHAFDAREGGFFRISLTYDAPTGIGKTAAHTDTYHGRFVKLVPNEQMVEVDEFETEDPALRREMTITITLADAEGGTDSSPYTTGCLPVYRRPTTQLAGRWPSQSSRHLSEPDQCQSTLELNVNFLRPVRPGRVVGRGRVVHRDGEMAFLEAYRCLRARVAAILLGLELPPSARVKRRHDPAGLFFVHHGVGGEHSSEAGFTKVRSG
jgi:uncharacterized protein YndB with AHSA1/START domain